jgi:hypothetical protein
MLDYTMISAITLSNHGKNTLHHYVKSFGRRFHFFQGRQACKPPRLMPGIDQGGHSLLIEAITRNRLAKFINEGSYYKTARHQK